MNNLTGIIKVFYISTNKYNYFILNKLPYKGHK